MADMNDTDRQGSGPYPSFTIFDAFHVMFTLAAAATVENSIVMQSGGLFFAVLGFVVTVAVGFFVFMYITAAIVLFLYRRYAPNSRVGFEAACYVLGHFKIPD